VLYAKKSPFLCCSVHVAVLSEQTVYYHCNPCREEAHSALFHKGNRDDEQDIHLIFKIDMKCRKELEPIKLLLDLLKMPSYDDSEDETVPWACTAQDVSPDMELQL
jgi:hypothetical protein